MGDRVLNVSEKYKPAINLIMPLNVRYSISTNSDLEQIKKWNLQFKAANSNLTMSYVLRKIIFRRINLENKGLNIKDEIDYENLHFKQLQEIKDNTYSLMKVVPRKKSFSQIVMEDLNGVLDGKIKII
jgi:hypothetical protein